ncbi:MAG TPA: MerR family transcriptional regulator [Trebonia sp.]|jgi:DNA-binding transcriptional MerR regulator|nr:MerR family transcriptional regulator [Trebonia sp.]
MLMAELSRRSGVPVATIKYYLREGLLPPGVPTAATRADYDDAHLRRLRLIRALIETGGVPIATIQQILSVVDDTSVGLHDMLGVVQYSLGPHLMPPADADPQWNAAMDEVDDLIGDLGWAVHEEAPARALLAGTLAALNRSGAAPLGAGLHAYAEALSALAADEVASIEVAAANAGAGADRVALSEAAVVGIVLFERALIALRRLAQEDASARRFG